MDQQEVITELAKASEHIDNLPEYYRYFIDDMMEDPGCTPRQRGAMTALIFLLLRDTRVLKQEVEALRKAHFALNS
jgi:hypothetical protein